jgi:hypothetical protein
MSTSLLSELRRRIRDVRYSVRAFGLAVSASSGATSAIAEITNHHLMIEVSGGSVPPLDLDLTNSRYNTIEKLHRVLSRAEGYSVQLDEDCNLDHLSSDLETFGPVNILGVGPDLRHHLFSDSELGEILSDATVRHNPTLTPLTVPAQEHPFVLQLAHANVCRNQAFDATKRKGLDQDVKSLINLAESFEAAYAADTLRLRRAIVSPKEANPNTMGEGDIVLGKNFRRSLRTGYNSPLSQNLPPSPAVLLEPTDQDIEDDNVMIRWQRNRDIDFYSYELWMDSQPEVMRIREGMISTSLPNAITSSDIGPRTESERIGSSKLIFRSFGANSNFGTVAYSTFAEAFGQMIQSFAMANLEPDTQYFFRLYIVDLNYEAVASNVVAITTRSLRCKFLKSPGYVSKISGPAGTVVDIYFDSDRAAFTAEHQIKVGEKIVAATILNPYRVQITIPSFVIKNQYRDLMVISPNGLYDNRRNAFQVTQQ